MFFLDRWIWSINKAHLSASLAKVEIWSTPRVICHIIIIFICSLVESIISIPDSATFSGLSIILKIKPLIIMLPKMSRFDFAPTDADIIYIEYIQYMYRYMHVFYACILFEFQTSSIMYFLFINYDCNNKVTQQALNKTQFSFNGVLVAIAVITFIF